MKRLIVFLAALGLSGCSLFGGGNESAENAGQPQAPAESQSAAEVADEYREIAAAMRAGESVRCVMTETETGDTATYQYKDGKMRIDGVDVMNAASGSMISDGDFMYTWSDTEKKGVKLPIPDGQDAADAAAEQDMQVPDLSDAEAVRNYEQTGYSVDCEQADVSDDVFVPPTDVTFTDMSAMMDNAQQMMQDGMENLTGEQQQAIEDQVQGLMDQFGQ